MKVSLTEECKGGQGFSLTSFVLHSKDLETDRKRFDGLMATSESEDTCLSVNSLFDGRSQDNSLRSRSKQSQ